MLRRLKSDVDFVIPPKREVVVYAQLSAVQQEMYRCILNKTIEQLVKTPSDQTPVHLRTAFDTLNVLALLLAEWATDAM